jgi:hypothetical protein
MHFRYIVRPQAILPFQLTKQLLSDIFLLHSAAKIRISEQNAKLI